MDVRRLWRAAGAVIQRDLRLGIRRVGGSGLSLFFFFTVTVVVTLGVGANLAQMSVVAPPLVWVLAFLSCVVSLETLLRPDREEGALDLLLCGSLPLWAALAAKGVAHWIGVGLPLTVMAPLMGFFFNLAPEAIPILMVTLGVGSLGLSFMGLLAAALTLPVRRGGVLAALLLVPLSVPILVSGLSAVQAGLLGSWALFGRVFLVEVVLVCVAGVLGSWVGAVVIALQEE